MSQQMLEVAALSSGYGAAQVVRSVSLNVAGGEVLALLGKNGMGKSTLLRTIMGYLNPQDGRIAIAGQDVTGAPVHRRARHGMAYAPQERALFQDLSIRDNLRLGLAHDRELPQALERVRTTFPFLTERLSQPAGTLSGGEQKMLLVARALMTAPCVVLVDEVTEGLQPSVVDRLAAVLRRAAVLDGRAILLVEQHVRFALEVADRYAVLKLGAIVASGSTRDADASDTIEALLRV
jgi:branched-chain amino acid transport system ATP-binding protein